MGLVTRTTSSSPAASRTGTPARRDRLTVKRSSAVCVVLARLPKVEINSDPTYQPGCRAILRRTQPSVRSPAHA